ncbi:MAG: DUF1772 domain-containing protein [Hyphomicrobiaceae bacterium]
MARARSQDLVLFITILATVLALGGGLAHAYELVNKIDLPQDAYFTVQQIYSGWNRFAFVLSVEATGMLVTIFLFRTEPAVLWPAVAAFLLLVLAQAVFWMFTFPANVATQNWTVAPADWQSLRAQWEYSHLAGAAFQLLALAALVVAVLRRGRAVVRRDGIERSDAFEAGVTSRRGAGGAELRRGRD